MTKRGSYGQEEDPQQQQQHPAQQQPLHQSGAAVFYHHITLLMTLEALPSTETPVAASRLAPNYSAILDLTAGPLYDLKLKSLMVNALPRFFCFFPELQDKAIDKHLDLCEDDSGIIRIEAIKALPLFGRDTSSEYGTKVADVLCQLLQTDIADEDAIVKDSLFRIWTIQPKATLSAIFHQIISGTSEVRSLTLRFISSYFLDKLTSNLQDGGLPRDIVAACNIGFSYFATCISKLLSEGHAKNIDPPDLDSIFKSMAIMALPQLSPSSSLSLPPPPPSPSSLNERCDMCIQVVIQAIEAQRVFEPAHPSSVDCLISAVNRSRPYLKALSTFQFFQLFDFILHRALSPATLLDKFPSDKKKLTVLKLVVDALGIGREGVRSVMNSGRAGVAVDTIISLFSTHVPISPSIRFSELVSFPRIECLLLVLNDLLNQHPSLASMASTDACLSRLSQLSYFVQNRIHQVHHDSNEIRMVENICSIAAHLLHHLSPSAHHQKQNHTLPSLPLITPSWHKIQAKRSASTADLNGKGIDYPPSASGDDNVTVQGFAPKIKRIQVVQGVPDESSLSAMTSVDRSGNVRIRNTLATPAEPLPTYIPPSGISAPVPTRSTTGTDAAAGVQPVQKLFLSSSSSRAIKPRRGGAALAMLQRGGLGIVKPHEVNITGAASAGAGASTSVSAVSSLSAASNSFSLPTADSSGSSSFRRDKAREDERMQAVSPAPPVAVIDVAPIPESKSTEAVALLMSGRINVGMVPPAVAPAAAPLIPVALAHADVAKSVQVPLVPTPSPLHKEQQQQGQPPPLPQRKSLFERLGVISLASSNSSVSAPVPLSSRLGTIVRPAVTAPKDALPQPSPQLPPSSSLFSRLGTISGALKPVENNSQKAKVSAIPGVLYDKEDSASEDGTSSTRKKQFKRRRQRR